MKCKNREHAEARKNAREDTRIDMRVDTREYRRKITHKIKKTKPKTDNSIVEKNSKQSSASLLDLPGEIRNRIYLYAVQSKCERVDYYFHYFNPQPAIARVSRQLRMESLSIYYNVNSFYILFGTPNDRRKFIDWTMMVGEKTCQQLRFLCLVIPTYQHSIVDSCILEANLNQTRSDIIIRYRWIGSEGVQCNNSVEELARGIVAAKDERELDGKDLVVFVKRLVSLVEADN